MKENRLIQFKRQQDEDGKTAPSDIETALGGGAPTAERVLKVLQGGAAGHSAKKVEVAGQAVDPQQAYENLRTALDLVKSRGAGFLRVSLDEISFRKFHGNVVGESGKEGVQVDPIMLLHPAYRLAHVIAHEAAHDRNEIQNEGLVESYIQLLFGEENPGEVYENAVNNFAEFAKRCDSDRNAERATKLIYQLYYSGGYEKIFEMYEENYIETLATDKEKDEAFKFFMLVFPELEYDGSEKPGHFALKTLEEKTDGPAIDPKAVKAKVRETEERIIK